MHEHRRRDDIDADGQRHRLQQLAESSALLVGSRLVTPVLLLLCLGMIGWIGNGFKDQLNEQGRDIGQVKTKLEVLGTRLDAQVIRQVDANTTDIRDLKTRVQVIERSVPTP